MHTFFICLHFSYLPSCEVNHVLWICNFINKFLPKSFKQRNIHVHVFTLESDHKQQKCMANTKLYKIYYEHASIKEFTDFPLTLTSDQES